MEPEEVKEYVSSDPQLSAEEKEMGIGFTKKDEKATFFTCISSQIKRALTHTDINVIKLSVFDESDESRWQTTVEEFDGEGTVVALKATVPIESLKIQSNPRSARSYASIISPQNEVNFE
jgi:hypothetical protein